MGNSAGSKAKVIVVKEPDAKAKNGKTSQKEIASTDVRSANGVKTKQTRSVEQPKEESADHSKGTSHCEDNLKTHSTEKHSKDNESSKEDATETPKNSESETQGNLKMGSSGDANTITLLHFNDVYNIEAREQEPVGGASRFATAVKQQQHLNPMVLFSGDAFNPSVMSTLTKGKQMVPIFNKFGVHCAVYGNHDFDHGVDTLVKHKDHSDFPWLLSNVLDNFTMAPLAEGIESKIIEWQGRKIGLVGLVEEEWIATLSTIDEDEITFLDYVSEGTSLAQELKEMGAEYIIALTHMRWPNDIKLAECVDEIDLILGGHDHDYGVQQINGKYVVKSGTDFREMSRVTLNFTDGKAKPEVKVEKLIVDSSIPEDPEVKEIVDEYQKVMGAKMEHVIGEMEVELDGRFASIRNKETNLGNFVTDIMLEGTEADIALLNSGTLRSDTVHPKGPFKMKDLMAILPMVDPVVVISIKGKDVVKALENGVSQWPKLEGRFPQVGGIKFAFDPEKPPGERITQDLVKVQGDYIEPEKHYRMATKSYLAEGKDGYDVFKNCEVILDDEKGPRLSTIVKNHFQTVKIVQGKKRPKFQHHQSLVPLQRKKSLVRQMTLPEDASILHSPTPSRLSFREDKRKSMATMRRRSSIEVIEHDPEQVATALAPKEEGRIVVLNPELQRQLEDERMAKMIKKSVIREETVEERE